MARPLSPSPPVPLQRRGDIVALEAAYTQFNAARTLRDALTCQTECHSLDSGGVLALDRSRPEDPDFNQLFLAGVDEVPEAIESALSRAADRGVGRLRVHVEPEQIAAASPVLDAAGFTAAWSQTYLVRSLDAPREAPALTARRLGARDADAFLDVLTQSGNPLLPEVRSARRRFYCTETFRTWVVELDQQWAGWATLWVPEGGKSGLFGNAWTLEPFRRRGVHRALLDARLKDARDLGLEWVMDDVIHGSVSHRNAERAGFRVSTVRSVWEGGVPHQPERPA